MKEYSCMVVFIAYQPFLGYFMHLSNPSACAIWDIVEFRIFFLLDWLAYQSKRTKSAQLFIHSWGWSGVEKWGGTCGFPKGINMKWKANSLVLDLNSIPPKDNMLHYAPLYIGLLYVDASLTVMVSFYMQRKNLSSQPF